MFALQSGGKKLGFDALGGDKSCSLRGREGEIDERELARFGKCRDNGGGVGEDERNWSKYSKSKAIALIRSGFLRDRHHFPPLGRKN